MWFIMNLFLKVRQLTRNFIWKFKTFARKDGEEKAQIMEGKATDAAP
jgi:hypothetical protein